MAKLGDYAKDLQAALNTYVERAEAYGQLKEFCNQIGDGAVVREGTGLQLRLSDRVLVPVSLPKETAQLESLVVPSLNQLGEQLAQCWDRLSEIANAGKAHCDEARDRFAGGSAAT